METFSRGDTSQQPNNAPASLTMDRFLRPGDAQATQPSPAQFNMFMSQLPDTRLTDSSQKLADGQLLPNVNIDRQQFRFTEQNFADAAVESAKTGKPIVALFGRPGTPASDNAQQKIAPHLQKQFGDRAEFVSINMDTPQGQKLAQAFNGSNESPYMAVLSLGRTADGKVKPVSAPSMGFRAGDVNACTNELNNLLPAADRSMQLAGFLRAEKPPTATDKPPTGPTGPNGPGPTGPGDIRPASDTTQQPSDIKPASDLQQDKPMQPASPYKTEAERKLAEAVAEDMKRVDALAAARKKNPGVTPADIPSTPNDTTVPPKDRVTPPQDKPKVPTDGKYKFTEGDFDQAVQAAIAQGKPIVLKVGASWCGPCNQMERNAWPKVQDVLKDNAIYVNVDADKAPDIRQRFGVTSYPTIMVLKPTQGDNGSVSFQHVGEQGSVMGAQQLRDYLQRNLGVR